MKPLFGNPKRIILIVVTLLIVFSTLAVSDGQAATRVVQLFYFLPNDRPYRQSVVDNIKTGILDVQSFFADQMEAHGHGRMTFDIETDGNGNPVVNRVNGAHAGTHYENDARIAEVREAFDTSSVVQLIVVDVASSSVSGRGTGIKQRGAVILYRQWNRDTTIHELGHAFGVQHDFRDDAYVMSYGGSRSSLSAGAAHFLAVNPYFNSSVPLQAGSAPSVELTSSTTYSHGVKSVPVTVRIQDPDGVQQASLFVQTPNRGKGDRPAGFDEVIEYRNLSGQTDVTVTFNYQGNTPSYGDTDLSNTSRHTISVSAVDRQGNRIDHKPSWTLQATDIKQAKVPVSQRSPRVRDYIFNHLRTFHDRNIGSYEDITDAHLEKINSVIVSNIRASDSPLQANDFDGLINVSSIELRFESGYSDNTLLPAGIFEGLTSLNGPNVKWYDTYGTDPSLFPVLPLTIGLRKVSDGKFKAYVPTGAPYDMDVPLIVVNGSITGDATSVKIPSGSTESEILTVTRTSGTTAAVSVDLERVVHATSGIGYAFYKTSFPLELLSPLAGAPTAVSERTPQVIEAIVAAVPEINHSHHNVDLTYVIDGKFVDKKYNTAPHVSEADLAAITSLNVAGNRGFVLGGLGNIRLSTHGNMTALKSGDFDGLSNLTSLNLNGNELSSLPSGIFDNLTELTSLNLLKNKLSSLTTGIFDRLTELDTLNLSGNELSSLPAGLFDKLTNLTNLNLLDNPLRSLPDGYFDKLTKLTTLFLPPNITPPLLPGAGTISPVANRTPKVRDAIVAAVPGLTSAANVTATHLAAITELDLSESKITALKTGDFDGLINLEGLRIGDTLSSLPDGIFDNLTRLEGLVLAGTLPSLPDGIFDNLLNLKTLAISGTQLSSLPDGIFDYFTNMQTFGLVNTQLTSLPDGIFDNFTNVPFIYLNDNQLSSLPAGIFDKATMRVFLHNNKLSALPDGIFKGSFTTAPDLKGLELLGVPLGQVPDDRLDELGEYTTVYLTGNTVDPLPLNISLKHVANGQFKAVAPAGAPFKLVLPISVTNGSISGGATSITIPVGSVESQTFTVTRTPGTTAAVTVDIGTLPALPQNHTGYTLVKSGGLVFTEFGGFLQVSERTPAVRDRIVRAVSGVTAAADVTEAHLAAITDFYVALRNSVKVGDFDGLTGLTSFSLGTGVTSLPAGLFKDLNNVTVMEWLDVNSTTLPSGTFTGLTSLDILVMEARSVTSLPAGVFNGLTNLTDLTFHAYQLTSLSGAVFAGLTNLTDLNFHIGQLTTLPDGLFSGLSSLKKLDLDGNVVSKMPLTVSLKKVTNEQFKAVAPTGAPFDIVLPLTLTNGSVTGGATSITIAKGSTESGTLTVTRTPGTTAAVTVNIGTLPGLPSGHSGYELVKSTTGLPLTLTPGVINSVPVFTEGTSATRSIAENTASGQNIGTAIAATDADSGDTLTYTLGGTDASSFSIVSTSGQLQTKAALDYETKTSYAVTITVSDGSGGSGTISVTINITDVSENRAPVFTAGGNATRTIAENTTANVNIGAALIATDADNDTLTYTLGGTDAASFGIVSTSGQLQTKAALDYETKRFYSVTVNVSDGRGGNDSIRVIINITDVADGVNSAPVFTDGSTTTRTVLENTASGQYIGTAIAATDTDNDTLTYTLSGADASSFSIVSTSGQLQTKAALDYETKNVYSVTVSVADGNGGTDSITVTINLADIDETLITPDRARTPQVRDAIVAAAGVKSIDDVTAVHLAAITFLNVSQKSISSLKAWDFDGLIALTTLWLYGNSISDISALEDLNSLTALTHLDLRVNSISDISALEDLTSLERLELSGNSIGDISALEDLTSLRTLFLFHNSISDISVLEDLTSLIWLDLRVNSISDISALEDLTSLERLELSGNPISDYGPLRRLRAAKPNVYIDIDINNNPPVFTDGSSTTRTIAENTVSGQNIGTALAARDSDSGDTLTWTLGGTDAASFRIVSTTGQLQTNTALDYETKSSYSVTVDVSDGNDGLDRITVTVNVTDIDETPITPVSDRTPKVRDAIVTAVPNISNAANVTAAHLAAITSLNLRNAGIAALKTEDFSGMTGLTTLNLFNNQLSSLPDGIFAGLTSLTTIRLGRNTVDPLPLSVSLEKVGTNQVKAVAPAGATFDIVLPITVTSGSISGGATTLTIPHGSMESETLTVTRTPGTTAAVTVDIGTLPSLPRGHYGYALVKSGNLPLDIITGINTAPVFTDGANTTRSVAENSTAGTHIGTAIAATDTENDTLTYTLSGADASAFDIDSSTGQLKTKAALDYETKTNYTVTITVSDGSLTDTITVTINVTDINEVVTPPITPDPPTANRAPVFTEGDSTTRVIAENTPAGVNIGNAVLATDANNDSLAYTLGGVDADAFDLDSSGQLKTKAPLDYETKRIYSVTITVEDDELSGTITVIISVIDVNDTVLSAGFVQVADRTPEVRDAIVAAVPNVAAAADVTESQVAAITALNLRNKGIASLKTGDFSGMTSLANLNLFGNQLSSLPSGIFEGLTALTTLRLGDNAVDPIPLIVSLQQTGSNTFKAIITAGAPFNIDLPLTVTGGSISGGTTSVTISQGATESTAFTLVGTAAEVSFGTLPGLPRNHFGYKLTQSTVCNRTTEVATAIAKAVGASDCSGVTELDLATITSLDLSGQSIASLSAGDFDGMLSLRTLSLSNNDIASLPSGIFDDLVSLSTLRLNSNKLTNVPGGIFSNLTSLTNLYLQSNDLSALPSEAFDGLAALSSINLQSNDLTSLPGDVFDGSPNLTSILLTNNKLTSIPNGIFEGLTQLNQLHLSWNPNPSSQLSIQVSLQKVGTNQVKAVAPSGAPFAIVVPISVKNGTLAGGATALRIPKGKVDSLPITVTRTAGTTDAVTANIGTLPNRPSHHNGYALAKGIGLPLEVLPPVNSSPVFTDGATTTRTVAENTVANANIGTAIAATDINKDKLTYTLGGADAAVFTVDSATGQLKTKAALNYETKNRYAVTLTVSDGKLNDTITVTINVSNVNEAPTFTDGNSVTREIAENTSTGANIGAVITATDPDKDTLTYSLGGTDASAFALGTSTGQLKTSAALDYETKSLYTLVLTVSDGKLTDTIAVTINVTDVQERSEQQIVEVETPTNNAPVFTEGSTATRTVLEGTSSGVDIGAAVSATDADGHSLTYTLGGTDAAAFSMDTTNGQLRTNAALDFETKSSYAVTITASDGTDTTTIDVTINVSNATENSAPVFSRFIAGVSVSRSVAENTGAGVDIGAPVVATDVDGDTLTYTLGGTDAAAFSIASTSGQLRTNAALDYETKTSYSVTITASDGNGGTDSINVLISVTDVDESPSNSAPVFSEGSSTTRSVLENTGSGVDIGSAVSATDADDDPLTYSLGGTDASTFSIDSFTGQLRTSSSLDYEAQNSYSVFVNVSDGQGSSASITLTINITNVNEAPVFTAGATTTRSIAENAGTGINIGSAVAATDPEASKLTYTLGGTNATSFSIDDATGQLKTKAALDYETKTTYTVTISVSDGNLTDTITVTINVTDLDETPSNNPPVFTAGATTTRSIPENTGGGSNIGTPIRATDADNNKLAYLLSGTDASSFAIDGDTGQLKTNAALNHETKSSYTVTVTVSDGSGTDTITVTITVTDVNEAPVLAAGESITFSVAENTAARRNIGSALSATDPDEDNELTYSLGGTDAASFGIVSTSGQLQTKAALDYEAKTSYSVTISVSDGKGGSDSIDVTVNVTDVDENRAPSFSDGASTTRSVAENTGAGVDIGTAVSATDPDNDTLTYTLGGANAASFGINSTNGQLRTNAALDYETKTSYSVTITVSDSKLTDSITVTINVTDVPENRAPAFSEGSSATRSIAENTASGVNIGNAVSATDPDTGNTLTYTLGGTDSASFSINSTNGQLRTSAALNYESKTSYSVTITVSDSNLTDSITVTINVTNVNEAPTFTDGTSTTRSIAENIAPGNNIGSAITATDPDSGTTLTYTLGGTDAASFSIVSTSGQLQTKAVFNYETDEKSYSVTVSASDGNGGSDNINVTINVTNGNDVPVFTDGTSTTRSVAENTTSGQNIGSAVAATDEDNHTLTYSLRGADAASFSIVSTSGQLQTKAALDYETYPFYSVIVSVSDGKGANTLIAVTINVTDVNEGGPNNAPTFTDGTSTTRSVAEGTAASQNIGSAVDATDTDTSDTLTYTLGGTDSASFSIVGTSGQLQTKAALDYETKKSYSVTVSVSDGNNGSDSIDVTINVTDVDEAGNDPPTFTEGSSTTRSVAENTASGQNIGDAVAATDSDSGDTLTYSLSGTDASSFSIVSTSGQLQTSAALDYETDTSHSVTVSVSDNNGGSDSISVTINVTDVTETVTISPALSTRTSQVRDAIVAAVPGVTDADDVTATHLAAITELRIYGAIGSLKAGDFNGLTALTTLNFWYTDLTSLPSGIFDKLTTLTNLGLHNKISSLPSDIFDKLTALNSLSFYRCDLTSLPSGIFDKLTALKTLDLYDNNLTSLPSDIFGKLTALTYLRLSAFGSNSNSISDVSELEDLTSLTELYISGNPISDYGPLRRLKTANPGVTIDINLDNNLPVFTDSTGITRSVAENTTSGQNIGTAVAATDADNHTLTYSLRGTDAVSFSIVSTSGQLQTNAALDYETKNSYSVTITVYDGNSGGANIDVTINVTDVDEAGNDPPTFTEGSSTTRSIAENTAAGQNIGNAVAATDSDSGDTLTYSLATTDLTSFSIVSTSGQLQTKAALDYETTQSYTVTVSVSDGNGGSDSITVTINVTDVQNEGGTGTTTYNVGDTIPSFPLSGTFSFGNTLTAGGTVYTCTTAGQCTITNGEVTAGTITAPADSSAPSTQASPKQTALLPNFPNPFNPETWIPFQLATPSEVTITIYDIRGRVMRVLVLGHQAAGVYRSRNTAAHWDGRNHFGEKAATGVYFYTLKAGNWTATRKMLIRK